MKNRLFKWFGLFFLGFILSACQNDKIGSLTLHFSHRVDNLPIDLHAMNYSNAAGNRYQIDEVKYFISKICLITEDSQYLTIPNVTNHPHYVDLSIEKTLQLPMHVKEGNYKGIAFVFGLDQEDNQSNRFVNPPESNFAWPEVLGGGYHYMQINGKWQANNGTIKAMNFHTGIGQLYTNNSMQIADIYQFVHNYFWVTVPLDFTVSSKHATSLNLVMNIENWFQNPNIYDHNEFGGAIMQNQIAQQIIKENGCDVFTLE